MVVADLCMDLLFTGTVKPRYDQVEQFVDDYDVEVGGSATIFAVQFAKLGGKVGVIGKVGRDSFGDMIVQRLSQFGVPVDHIQADTTSKTGVGLNLSCYADRAMLTYTGSMDRIVPADIGPGYAQRTRHWHVASYFLLRNLWDFWPAHLTALRRQGVTISLDTNWSPESNWSHVQTILPLIDVFLPNEEEARQITGCADTREAGRMLASLCPLVIVKCGAAGALAFQRENVVPMHIPPALTANLVIRDTTGAGDNFDAGFLHAWLQQRPLEECLLMGIRCGTSSLAAIGGIAAQYIPR